MKFAVVAAMLVLTTVSARADIQAGQQIDLRCDGTIDKYTIHMEARDQGKGLYLTRMDVSANLFAIGGGGSNPWQPQVVESSSIAVTGNLTREMQVLEYTNWWNGKTFQNTHKKINGSLNVDLDFTKGLVTMSCDLTVSGSASH